MRNLSILIFATLFATARFSSDAQIASNVPAIDSSNQEKQATSAVDTQSEKEEEIGINVKVDVAQPTSDSHSDNGLQERFIELERRLIDRESQIVTWWLTLVLIILAIITIVVGGYGSYALITTGSRRDEVKKIKNETEALTLVADGNLLLAQKNYLGAEAKFASAVGLNPSLSVAHKNLGIMQVNLEKFELAIENLTRYLNLEPESGEGLACRGLAYSKLGKYQLAENDFLSALKLDVSDYQVWSGLAFVLHSKGNFKEAIEHSEKSISLNENNAEAWNLMATSKQSLNWNSDVNPKPYSSNEIIDNLKKALEIDATNASYHNNIGLEFESIGDREKALEFFSNAILLKPDYEAAIKHRAQLNFIMNNTDEAEIDIRRVLELESQNPDLIQMLARILYDRGDFEEAFELSEQSIIMDPKQKRGYMNYAIFLYEQKNVEKAIEELLRGLEATGVHQRYIELLESIGQEQFEEKNYDFAIRAFCALVDNFGLSDHWGSMIATSYNNWGKYDEAIAFLDRCIEQHPDFTPYYNDRGYALHQKGRYSEAIRDRRYVLEHGGSGLPLLIGLADSLIKNNDLEEAQAVIDDAISFSKENSDEDKQVGDNLFIAGLVSQL